MGTRFRAEIQGRASLAGCVLLGGALILAAGCAEAERKPDASIQATVTGSVLKDGKPIAVDSQVLFYCSDQDSTAGGKIDALGKFSLSAADHRNGIPAGRYKVTVRGPEKPAAAVGTADYQKLMTGGAPAAPLASNSEIPIEFQSLDTTKLSLEVKPGANNFDIDLAKLNL